MCIAIGSDNRLRWQPLAAISGPRPSFKAPWDEAAVQADFKARVAFFDSILLDQVLSAAESDELSAHRDVYKALASMASTGKAEVVAWLSDALAEHLTSTAAVSRAYSLAHLSLVNELTDAVFAS